MPLSAAATEAAMDAQGTRTITGRQVVHVTLVFDGVAWNPGAFYDTLNAAYGTVSSLRDAFDPSISQGNYEFLIAP